MGIEIIRGITEKNAASRLLIEVLENYPTLNGQLYIGYPILGTFETRTPIDALLISPEIGLVIFDLVEGNIPGDFQSRQDESATRLDAKLKVHSSLVSKRNLIPNLSVVTYGPAIPNALNDATAEYPIANNMAVEAFLDSLPRSPDNEAVFDKLLSALQNISTIRQSRTKRFVEQENSRGAKLKKLEEKIATLDSAQSRAVIETVRGVQRIRGLAGSGKTIVLALKAAYLHAQYPNWKIAVTFYTRSLKSQLKRHINNFCISQTGEEPDWTRIKIIHAWGSSGSEDKDGLYYQYCNLHNISHLDYTSAKNKFGYEAAFRGACDQAIGSQIIEKPVYDAILVDEAQDLPSSFLQICYSLLTPDKHLVYAYDELQTLSGPSVPPPEQLFGQTADGLPKVSLAEPSPNGATRDIILDICYRNSRPVLSSAHALGFGIYRKPPKDKSTGLVQMFGEPSLWTDVGYSVKEGELSPNEVVRLSRTTRTSPEFLEDHSDSNDLIQFYTFSSSEEQSEWLAQAIKCNLDEDELQGDDIIVINPDPLTTRSEVGPIRGILRTLGVESHIAGVTTEADVFFQSDSSSITFSGINRAKGNEAGLVYIINAQDCHASSYNLARIRNRLFTAMTRSKAWVRVLGVGTGMKAVEAEFNKIVQEGFDLNFRYPTEKERSELSISYRDLESTTKKKIDKGKKDLIALANSIESGEILLEDLGPDIIMKLRGLVSEQ